MRRVEVVVPDGRVGRAQDAARLGEGAVLDLRTPGVLPLVAGAAVGEARQQGRRPHALLGVVTAHVAAARSDRRDLVERQLVLAELEAAPGALVHQGDLVVGHALAEVESHQRAEEARPC